MSTPKWSELFDFDDSRVNGAITRAALAIAEAFRFAYGEPLVGRTRMVFIDRHQNVVYKLPFNYDGIAANEQEAAAFQRQEAGEPGYIPIAPCQICFDDDIALVAERSSNSGIPILRTTYLRPVNVPASDLPAWTQSVDCAQVGLDENGELLAFDP